ncbi:cytochrome P450 [Penicillium lividum]|nr:cytochrome P450 [Penicillium lividum]
MAIFSIALILTAVTSLAFYYAFGLVRSPAIPPNLRAVPLAGDPSELGRYPNQQLRKWALANGELFRIKLGWTTWIYVNSPEAVK